MYGARIEILPKFYFPQVQFNDLENNSAEAVFDPRRPGSAFQDCCRDHDTTGRDWSGKARDTINKLDSTHEVS